MEKQNNIRKIKIVLLDIFPSIEELETSKNEIVIIFQDNNNFYSVNQLLTEKSEINFSTELSSIIISLIKKDNILATSIFNIRQGEQWLTFTYENQKKNSPTNLALILMNCIKIKLICEISMFNVTHNNINNNINNNEQTKILHLNKKIERYFGSPCKIRFVTRKEADSKDITKEYSKDNYNSFLTEENKKSNTLIEKKITKINFKNLKALINSPKKSKIISVGEIINMTSQNTNQNSSQKSLELKKSKTKKLIKPLSGLNSEKSSNKRNNFLTTALKSQRIFNPLNKNSSRNNFSNRSNKNLNLIKRDAINSMKKLLNDDKNSKTINTTSSERNKYKSINKNKDNNNGFNIPKHSVENFYSNITLKKKHSKFSFNNISINGQEDKNKKIQNINTNKINTSKTKIRNIEMNGPFSSRRLKNCLVKKSGGISKSKIFNKSAENYHKKEKVTNENKTSKSHTYNSDSDSDFYNEMPDDDSKLESNFLKLKEDYILLYNEEYLQNIQDDLLKLELELFVEKMIALIYEYHSEIKILMIENKLMENSLRINMKKHFWINKLFNKLYIIKREKKSKKYNKNKNHIDKLNSNNLNLNKNEIDIFKLLFPTKKNIKFNSIEKKEMLKNILNIVLYKIENRELIMNQNEKYKNWIEKNYDLKNYKGLLKTRVRAIPKIKNKKDYTSQICNKSAINIKDHDKNIHYNSHSHDGKKEADIAYVKKPIISPINPQKCYYRRKIHK